uniref:Uncharacterized protein n=1 Tax=Xiphophorus couchianus TaxID=32473 RepID=A0A3B5MT43_9TELE
ATSSISRYKSTGEDARGDGFLPPTHKADKMKKINKPEKRCKPINTFFLDTKGVLTGICNFGKNRQTHAINLKIIDCKSFKNSNGYPHRKYRAVKEKEIMVNFPLCAASMFCTSSNN